MPKDYDEHAVESDFRAKPDNVPARITICAVAWLCFFGLFLWAVALGAAIAWVLSRGGGQ